ncbi:hypothetical protein [Pseudomonas sp. EL_65y_Pfl2_R96]|uniref:hypothetical protein n=1 Tax=Pseudomonas sp. EL_65y_Pfl2_R96 TaxID=3088699 RepID=UPI0030D9DF5A
MGMVKNLATDNQKMGVLFEADRRISAEYRCASSLLQEEEVAKKLKFLGALDRLAHKNDFSARDVINLLKPEYFEQPREQGASMQIKDFHDRLVEDSEQEEK